MALSMNHLLSVIVLLMMACSSSSDPVISSPVTPPQQGTNNPPTSATNVLIVYLSRTNNTKALAELIHQRVGGTLMALELEKPYPENYRATVDQVANENETGFLPPLKTKIANMAQFDVVFVGFPTWGMQLPPPMKSFLRQYDLKGKTIIPFNSNGGYGIGSSFQTVKELCPNSNVLAGFTTRGGSERDGQFLVIKDERARQAGTEVDTWLKKINVR